jgi:hypothetical protein
MIYDIECFKNFFSITLKEKEKVYQYVLHNDIEKKMSKDDLLELVKGETLIGYNNKRYDDLMLDFFIDRDIVTNQELKKFNDYLFKTEENWYMIRQEKITRPRKFESIDLFRRNPLGEKQSLKMYEHYKRLNNISETPVDFQSNVKDEEVELVLQYNLDDVVATEILYDEVTPLLESLTELSKEYDVKDILSQTSGGIVDKLFKTFKFEKIPQKLIIDLKQNIDFTIKDQVVLEHLNKLQNYNVKEYDLTEIKSEVKEKTKIRSVEYDITRECQPSFTATILNAEIQFGIGGLHSNVEPLNLTANDDYAIIDCDVNGMYPNVTIKQKLTPFYFSNNDRETFLKVYQEIIDKRDMLKSQGSTLEQSYKLIANTLTGKFKEINSILYDPSCHIKICTYGQYFLFSVLEQVEQYVDTICQVNTDGFTLYVRREYLKDIENVLNNTKDIKWKVKHFKKFISQNCNNYVALTDKDEVKPKGAMFNIETYSKPQIIKISLMDYLLFDKDIEQSVSECKDIYDFLFVHKSSKSLTIGDEPFMGKIIRFYKSKSGHTIKSNNNQIPNGDNAVEQNKIDQSKLSDVDLQFYINETKKQVTTIVGHEHQDVVNLFAEYNILLCGKTGLKQKDGTTLFKGSANKGQYLYSYETIGIDMIEYPQLMYVDIDHIANEHRLIIDMCLSANTIYSTSDVNKDSYRFFFKNNTDITGNYRWQNKDKETSFEIWNSIGNKVSISGTKRKDEFNEVIERYIIVNDTLQTFPIDLLDWVKANPPSNVKSAVKKQTIKKIDTKMNYNEQIEQLFELIKDKYKVELTEKKGEKSITFNAPPDWYELTGGWRDSLVLLQKTTSKTFDIHFHSYTGSFSEQDKERLYNELSKYFENGLVKQSENRLQDVVNQLVSSVNNPNIVNTNTLQKEELDDDDEKILEKSPVIPKFVYDNLPEMLKEMCSKFNNNREKDVLLTAVLATTSSMLSECYGIYFKTTIYPNIYTFVSAGAGNLKGSAKFAFDLTYRLRTEMHNEYLREKLIFEAEEKNKKLESPKEKTLKIAGNSSAATFLQKLERNVGNGLIFEQEADAIVEAFKKEWGNYDEMLRKAFQHEYLDSDRMTYNIAIDKPKLSIFVSGTPAQLFSLIKSSENGLFSRFFYYIFQSESKYLDPFEDDEVDFHQYFRDKSNIIYDFYKYYQENPVKLKLSSEQKIIFNNRIGFMFNDLRDRHEGADIESAVKRLGTMTFKLLILFSCITNFENKKKYDGILEVNNVDLEVVLQIVETYSQHMEIIYVNLSKQENIKFKSNPIDKLTTFIMSQTGSFTRELIVQQTKNLGKSESTADKEIRKLKKKNKIKNIDRFHYIVVK